MHARSHHRPPSTSLHRLWNWIGRTPMRGAAAALALTAAVAALDYVTGYEIRLAILYLIPIALSTWIGGMRTGIPISLAAAACWGISFYPNTMYSHGVFYYWEGAVLASTFAIFMWLIDRLRGTLAGADARLLLVLEGLPAGIAVLSKGGQRLLYSNHRFAEILGGDPRPLDAAAFAARFRIEAAAPALGKAGLPAALRCEEARDAETGRWYLLQSGQIDWTSNTQATLNVLLDITEQKQALALKRQQQEMLNKTSRFAVLAEIASVLAHEINQPLMAISSYNDASIMLLAKNPPDVPAVALALEKSRAQAVRASRIIERTRNFLRQRRPDSSRCSINDVVADALQSMEVELNDSSVVVEPHLADDLPPAVFDRTLIEQAIINLLENAVDAVRGNPPAERAVSVSTSRGEDNFLLVCVSDRGTGIAEEIADTLYAPFTTTKPQGLGLGLSICQSVIETHAGRLWHAPNPAGGTCFCFTLPCEGVRDE